MLGLVAEEDDVLDPVGEEVEVGDVPLDLDESRRLLFLGLVVVVVVVGGGGVVVLVAARVEGRVDGVALLCRDRAVPDGVTCSYGAEEDPVHPGEFFGNTLVALSH